MVKSAWKGGKGEGEGRRASSPIPQAPIAEKGVSKQIRKRWTKSSDLSKLWLARWRDTVLDSDRRANSTDRPGKSVDVGG